MTAETERTFSEDVKVSKLTLDMHAENQAELQNYYGQKVAEAKEIEDEEEARLNLLLADKELHYRRNPPMEKDAKGADVPMKLTEAIVKALVTSDPDVQVAQKRVRTASRDLNGWKAAEKAIDQRKSMIDTLARLHASSYFATPRQGASSDTPSRGFRPET